MCSISRTVITLRNLVVAYSSTHHIFSREPQALTGWAAGGTALWTWDRGPSPQPPSSAQSSQVCSRGLKNTLSDEFAHQQSLAIHITLNLFTTAVIYHGLSHITAGWNANFSVEFSPSRSLWMMLSMLISPSAMAGVCVETFLDQPMSPI